MSLPVADYQAARKAVANFSRFAGYEVHEADNAEGPGTFSKGGHFDVLIAGASFSLVNALSHLQSEASARKIEP